MGRKTCRRAHRTLDAWPPSGQHHDECFGRFPSKMPAMRREESACGGLRKPNNVSAARLDCCSSKCPSHLDLDEFIVRLGCESIWVRSTSRNLSVRFHPVALAQVD